MPEGSIIHNAVNIEVRIDKLADASWRITPSLTAHPTPRVPTPKNIIFILDCSGSMENRLAKVKIAVSNLLDKLNKIDTFSIIFFHDNAQICVKNQIATAKGIQHAKAQMQTLSAAGHTNFKAAFAAIQTEKLIKKQNQTLVIFLTDGEDSFHCTHDMLLNLFPKKKLPKTIPIGILLDKQNDFLNKLAKLCGTEAYYIQDENQSSYQQAFETAFQYAIERSQAPAKLEMIITANSKTDRTRLKVLRTLNHVHYDKSTPTRTSLDLDSPSPPFYLQLHFQCDHMFLYTNHRFTPAERKQLSQGQSLNLKIPAFKWKNNTTASWILTLGSLALGILLLAGLAVFALSAPPISAWLWQTLTIAAVTGLAGVLVFLYGMLELTRKTLFLPTKWSAEIELAQARRSSNLFALSNRNKQLGYPPTQAVAAQHL